MTALKYLRHFQRSSFENAARAKLTPAVSREIEVLMQHYLTYMLERSLNTPAFLRRVRKGSELQALEEDFDYEESGEDEE